MTPAAAHATAKAYDAAAAQTHHSLSRLQGVQANIDEATLAEFTRDYKSGGGEQFVPDKEKIKCERCQRSTLLPQRVLTSSGAVDPSRQDAFAELQKLERDEVAGASRLQDEDEAPLPTASTVINTALELEIAQ